MRPAGLKAQKGAGVRDPIRGARRGTAGRWCNDRLNPPGSIVPKIDNNSSRCWRLRELVWVGGCVTVPTAWASPHWRRGPHRQGDDAGVYTDRREWPLEAVSGHLCTLLRRELRQLPRAPQPPWRAGGPSSLAPPAWSGKQTLSEWRRCQVGIFAEAVNPHKPLKSPMLLRIRKSVVPR